MPRWSVVLFTALLAGACGGDSSPIAAGEGAVERECRDGLDNDGDGLVDCEEPVCDCSPPSGAADVTDATAGDVPDAGPTDSAGADADVDFEVDFDVDPDVAPADGSGDASADDAEDPDASVDPDAGETGVDLSDDTPDGGSGPTPIRSCSTIVEHLAPGAAEVQLAGPFTEWDTAPITLEALGDGRFRTSLSLPPGEHPYKFIVDGTWDWQDMSEAPPPVDFLTHWVGGSENRNLVVGDCQVPLLEVVSAESDASGVRAALRFVRGADGSPLDPASVRVRVGSVDVTPEIDLSAGLITVDAPDLRSGKHSIWVWASDEAGRPVEEEPLYLPLWVEDAPFVWQDATMYFVFTDRFRDSDAGAAEPIAVPVPGVPTIANYQGGDFRGVTDAIEEGYFDALGVNLLWLSPVQENPDGDYIAVDREHDFSGFHGYWPSHARQIEFRWGDVGGDSATRLHELIGAAHDRGIRVLFDVPLNHVHQDHEYVDRFPEWFRAEPCTCTSDPGPCNWDTNPIYCWFIDYLPDLDFKNHAIVEQVGEDLEWLVSTFDVDALRIDAAKHMDHVIMRRIALRLNERIDARGGAPLYLVGETFTHVDGHGLIMDYVSDSELDGQFDFPLLWPIRDAFAYGGSFRDLADRRRIGEERYGAFYTWMSPFLGNHDIPRFSALLFEGGAGIDPWADIPDPMEAGLNDGTWNSINRMSLAFLFVLTQPGIPLIYYGDEIGLYGGGDPDNRRPMRWGDLSEAQEILLDRVRAVGRARADHAALRRGRFHELWADGDVLIYARVHGDEVAIVAMNKGEGGSRNVPIPADLGLEARRLADVLGGSVDVRVSGGNATFTLADWQYAILVPVADP